MLLVQFGAFSEESAVCFIQPTPAVHASVRYAEMKISKTGEQSQQAHNVETTSIQY